MTIIKRIIQELDLLETAREFGFTDYRQEGLGRYRGACPCHDSKSKNGFVIDTQLGLFHDFGGCGSGNVFNLIMLARKCDFKEALRFAAGKLGIKLDKNISDEEWNKLQNERKEIEHIQPEIFKIYKEHLPEELKEKIKKDRGFTDETIEKYMLGYSSAEANKKILEKFNHNTLILTGLFLKGNNGIYPLYNNRIVYPYFLFDKPVYSIAGITDKTPKKTYEEAKYKKQIVKSERHPGVSKLIQNILYGQDSIQDNDTVIITEGITDAISVLQAGAGVISPIAPKYKTEHFEKTAKHLTDKEVIIINDNEENEVGLTEAIKLAKYLFSKGVENVKIAEIPKPTGTGKIDLNDFLKDADSEEQKESLGILIEKANHIIKFHIIKLSTNEIGKNKEVKEILELISDKDPLLKEGYLRQLSGATKITKKVLQETLENIQKENNHNDLLQVFEKKKEKESNVKPDYVPLTAEEEKEALALLKNPNLIEELHKEIDKTHKEDHKEKIALALIAVSSELPRAEDHQSAALKGGTSAGKDNAGKTVLSLFPEEDNFFLTRATTAALEDEIHHVKRIAFSEINKHREDGVNAPIVEIFKQMADGGIKILKKSQENKGETIHIEVEQKTLFYGTTEDESDEELESRYVEIPIKSDPEKNKIVVADTLDKAANPLIVNNKNNRFQNAIKLLKKESVRDIVIPFAPLFKEKIKDGDKELYLFDFRKDRIKRDAKRLMALTKAYTWLHQKQRTINNKGQIVAEPQDFLFILLVFSEFFNLTYKGIDHRIDNCLQEIKIMEKQHNGYLMDMNYPEDYHGWVMRNKLQEKLGISLNTIKKWIYILKDEGLIQVNYDPDFPKVYLIRPVKRPISDLSLPISLNGVTGALIGWLIGKQNHTSIQKQNNKNDSYRKINEFKDKIKKMSSFFEKLTRQSLTRQNPTEPKEEKTPDNPERQGSQDISDKKDLIHHKCYGCGETPCVEWSRTGRPLCELCIQKKEVAQS